MSQGQPVYVADLADRLAELESNGLRRRLRMVDGAQGPRVVLDGKRVSLGEVEACIESYELVHRARAQLINDPLGGPMVVAQVVLKGADDPDPEEIIDHCARNLSPFKVPRRITFVSSLG